MKIHTLVCAVVAIAFAAPSAAQQAPYDPAAVVRTQAEAMAPLTMFDGVWRGPATIHMPDGKVLELTQTERFGPMLDGSLRVVEGRGHDSTGAVKFNAFGIVSYNARTKAYSLHSYAQGQASDFPVQLLSDGWVWTMQAGPGASIRYTARIENGDWYEIGEHIVEGQPPVRTFEMRLKRIGDSTWPAGGAIGLK